MSRVRGTATQFRPVGNYLEGLNYDPRQAIANLEKVIGKLPNQYNYDYTGQQARTFGDLTETLLERAPKVVPMQVTGLIEKSYVSPFTTICLPIRQLGELEGLRVSWTQMNFNPAFADQVEVLGLGRYFTHNKTRRSARAVRRGAAVKIEAGFFMTQEGRDEWALQIEQLATAIQETNEYDVLITLLQVPMNQVIDAQEMNGPYNHIFYGARQDLTFVERLTLMRDNFGIINKTPDSRGFAGMVTNLRTIMARNGSVSPDLIIVPPYVIGYYHFTKDDLWQYQSAGPAVAQNRANATDIGDNGPIRSQTIQGLRIIDTNVYRPVKGARTSANDLLTVPVQIGEFYPMCIDMFYRDSRSFVNYRSSHRDITIFNEDQSRFVPVYFLDALKNSFRFRDPDVHGSRGPLDPERHTEKIKRDLFKRNNGSVTINKWAEMSSEYLRDETVLRVVNSVKGNLIEKPMWDAMNAMAPFAGADGDAIAEADAAFVAFKDQVAPFVAKLTAAFGTNFTALSLAKLSRGFDNQANQVGGFQVGANPPDRSRIFSKEDNATKYVAAAFLHASVDYETMKNMHECDIYVPVNILLSRPWMTYYASTIIIMKGGVETGETIIGRQDFQMSANTQTRELEASMMYYGKAIVRNPNNVMVAPHVFIQSYIRGNNTEWITEDTLEHIRDNSGVVDGTESLVSMVIPATSRVYAENWIDYRGKHADYEKVFHESLEFYSEVYNIIDAELWTPNESFIDYEAQTYQTNSICWAGHVNYGPDFKFQSLCQSPLGTLTYDQCNNSRKEGLYSPIQHLTYNVTQL